MNKQNGIKKMLRNIKILYLATPSPLYDHGIMQFIPV